MNSSSLVVEDPEPKAALKTLKIAFVVAISDSGDSESRSRVANFMAVSERMVRLRPVIMLASGSVDFPYAPRTTQRAPAALIKTFCKAENSAGVSVARRGR